MTTVAKVKENLKGWQLSLCAHVAITVLSLLLDRVIEHACQDTWHNIHDNLKRIHLAQLSSPNGTI
jgi:hypothetical protein